MARNPVHSVLWLILAFLSAAGLFVLLGAEFVAMLLIIVYVGAVAVLFLFVVMMLDIDFAELKGEMARYMPLGLLIGRGDPDAARHRPSAPGMPADGAPGLRQAVTPDGEIENTRALALLIYDQLHLPVPAGRADPAGGDDRGDRADPAPPQGRQAPERAGSRCGATRPRRWN